MVLFMTDAKIFNKISYQYDKEPKPTYYANTNLFSRRLFRRRPKTTGPITKECLDKVK